MTIKDLSEFLDGVRGHQNCDVVVRVRRPGEDAEVLEITAVVVTLERDTGEDIVEIEVGTA